MEIELNRYFGILMSKKTIDEGIIVFIPESLVEGKIVEYEDGYSYFRDINGIEYLLMEDVENITGNESCVGFVINDEEIYQYSNNSELDWDEAKHLYFEASQKLTHFGFYHVLENRIVVMSLNLNRVLDRINECDNISNLNISDEELYTILMSDEIDFLDNLEEMDNVSNIEKINKEQAEVVLSIDVFKNIVNSKSLEEMKQKLDKIDLIFEKLLRGEVVQEEDNFNLDEHDKREKELEEVFSHLDEYNSTTALKYNVKEMKRYFDSKIIGQEEAKKDVILSVVMNSLSTDSKDRNSCLLIGPTGSGKTLIVQVLAEYLNKPMQIIDTTQLTVPGYVGSNIEDFLEKLISKANGDIKKAEEGIVVFDEIDKKGSDKNSDISGRGLLNTLLPFMQGTDYTVPYKGKKVNFNTSKLTILATGAFANVANKGDSDKAYTNNTIGYLSNLNNVKKEDIEYPKITIEDLEKYGNMPIELLGRFTTISQLSGHTQESLCKILTESEISPLKSSKEKLEKVGVELSWTKDYLEEVANKALELKTGARSLKATVDKSIKEVSWKVIEDLGKYSSIVLTKDTVLDNTNCLLIDKNYEYGTNLQNVLENHKNRKENAKVYVKK